MTHVRFLYKEGRKLGDNYYVRADGTRVFYFTTESLAALFERCGYETATTNFDTRELRNRKKMINMYRVWVNGKFVKTKDE
jgi:tRNAThr (cytosine32-N3)-methyltransferase